MSPLPGIFASQTTGHLDNFQGNYWSIGSTTVASGGVAAVTFAGIPTNFTHLQLRIKARSAAAASTDVIKWTFNNDEGSNYARHTLYADTAVASAAAVSATYNSCGDCPGASAASNVFGVYVLDILDYGNTSKNKTTRAIGGYDLNGSGNVDLRSNLWISTTAISGIKFFTTSGSNIAQNSTFSLYGVK